MIERVFLMDDWIKLISAVGFPIVMCCYVLFRLENTIKANTDQIVKLTIVLARKGVNLDD